MSKTGWANAIGSIGQGLLVFGANREKLNYEKERDANMLELEREQMQATKDHQGKVLEQKDTQLGIQRDQADSGIALDTQQIAASKATTSATLQESQAALETQAQQTVEFETTQRIMGNEKFTDPETGAVTYKYNEELFESTKTERMAARNAGSSVSAAVQAIQENTTSKIAERDDNPNDPRFMKEVKGEDGSVTEVLKTDSDLRAEANQEYQTSLQSSTTLRAKAEIQGIDNRLKDVNQQLKDARADVFSGSKDKDPDTGLTEKETRIQELEAEAQGLQSLRRGWTSTLQAGPGAPTYGTSARSTAQNGDGLMQNGETGPGTTPGGTAYLNTLNIDPTATD